MHVSRSTVTLAAGVLGLAGIGIFLATRDGAEEDISAAVTAQPTATPVDVVPREDIDEGAGPRFAGELLGLYFAPEESLVPATYKEKQAALDAGRPPCTTSRPEQSFGRAGEFALSFTLPDSFTLDPLESGLVVCNDTDSVGSAHWVYRTNFNGSAGELAVVRGPGLAHYVTSVASDRVSVISAGGRQAILISPLLPESGYGSTAGVVFVEPDGTMNTGVGSNNVPLSELLAAAEIVGLALVPAR